MMPELISNDVLNNVVPVATSGAISARLLTVALKWCCNELVVTIIMVIMLTGGNSAGTTDCLSHHQAGNQTDLG